MFPRHEMNVLKINQQGDDLWQKKSSEDMPCWIFCKKKVALRVCSQLTLCLIGERVDIYQGDMLIHSFI